MIHDTKGARKHGRPRGSTKVPQQQLLDVWLQVELRRERTKERSGKYPSAKKSCDAICGGPGLIWIVGGDAEEIARGIEQHPTSPLTDTRRQKLVESGDQLRLVNDVRGTIFVNHKIEHARSLRTRYTEANRLVQCNPEIRKAWTNIFYDMLGRPRPYPVPSLGRFGTRIPMESQNS